MPSPLVIEALREQLLRVLDWYGREREAFGWGVVIHRRNERGRLRFGVVTPTGESMLLTEPLLGALAGTPCWLDGAVPVRVGFGRLSQPQTCLDTLARGDRPPLVGSLAVHLEADASREGAQAGNLTTDAPTPATLPSELFLLTRERPRAWPR
jgi:hypothetical protein